jgi:hypothetical protein
VRAELAGYRTASAVLMSTGDQTLDLKLEEISRGESQKKPTPPIRIPQKAVAPQAASRSAPKSADCAQRSTWARMGSRNQARLSVGPARGTAKP